MKYRKLQSILLGAVLFSGCTATIPEQFVQADALPVVFPAYSDIAIPYNIAPLNVAYEMEGEVFVSELKAGDETLVMKGKHTDWNIKKWHSFL